LWQAISLAHRHNEIARLLAKLIHALWLRVPEGVMRLEQLEIEAPQFRTPADGCRQAIRHTGAIKSWPEGLREGRRERE
jgi:hypothetical protein